MNARGINCFIAMVCHEYTFSIDRLNEYKKNKLYCNLILCAYNCFNSYDTKSLILFVSASETDQNSECKTNSPLSVPFFPGITRLPVLEGEVSHVEIPRTSQSLGITIVGGADTPLVGQHSHFSVFITFFCFIRDV